MQNLNIANSIFSGFNDSQGLMLCGYEWGYSKEEQEAAQNSQAIVIDTSIDCTFSNKFLRYGEIVKKWRYDNNLIKWFELWGHPLNRVGLGDDFDKSIIQTNWCNTQAHKIEGDIFKKLLDDEQIDNFIYHIKALKPSLIIFSGSQLLPVLQNKKVIDRFQEIMGNETSPVSYMQKDFTGIRFKFGFQSFEKCQIVGLPHPSGSHGINDEYIVKFKSEIDKIINDYKVSRGF